VPAAPRITGVATLQLSAILDDWVSDVSGVVSREWHPDPVSLGLEPEGQATQFGYTFDLTGFTYSDHASTGLGIFDATIDPLPAEVDDDEIPASTPNTDLLEGPTFGFADAPYPIREGTALVGDDEGGEIPPFIDPNPVIISVIANELHQVVATVNAGPTDAGDVTTWWEVELVDGSEEFFIVIDRLAGNRFDTNHNQVDTWTIPFGQDFDEKRIRFVIQAERDGQQVFRSLYLRMEGNEFDNDPPETVIIPGPGQDGPPPLTDLEVSIEQQQLVLRREQARRARTLQLSTDSRYKLTRLFEGDEGLVFGLLSVLDDFYTLGDDYQIHRVTAPEVGFLDIVAARFFGPGNESLWWVIAYANGIIDPDVDMFPGQTLVIPTRQRLLRFLERRPEPAGT
jgi:hypothetical protein